MKFVITSNQNLSTEVPKIVHYKNSRRNKIKLTKSEYEQTIIKWSLRKYVKEIEYDPNSCEFLPMFSSSILENGLTSIKILEFLNSILIINNYIPENNDILKIWLEYKHPIIYKPRPYIDNFILFRFFAEEWIEDTGFDRIDKIYEDIYDGELFIEDI